MACLLHSAPPILWSCSESTCLAAQATCLRKAACRRTAPLSACATPRTGVCAPVRAQIVEDKQVVQVCYDCLQKNAGILQPLVIRESMGQAAAGGSAGQQPAQERRPLLPLRPTDHSSQTLRATPATHFVAGGEQVPQAGAARGPSRGKGKQPAQPRKRKGGSDEEYNDAMERRQRQQQQGQGGRSGRYGLPQDADSDSEFEAMAGRPLRATRRKQAVNVSEGSRTACGCVCRMPLLLQMVALQFCADQLPSSCAQRHLAHAALLAALLSSRKRTVFLLSGQSPFCGLTCHVNTMLPHFRTFSQAEPVCIDLLSDDDHGAGGEQQGAAVAAEAEEAPARRVQPARAAAYRSTAERFKVGSGQPGGQASAKPWSDGRRPAYLRSMAPPAARPARARPAVACPAVCLPALPAANRPAPCRAATPLRASSAFTRPAAGPAPLR